MFIDKVKIFCKAGDGGNGSRSLHTEKYMANGGPDGGDGGKGGDLIFVATNSLNNLNEFHFTKHFRAFNGENGSEKNCYGKSGKDLVVSVPVGTVIRDAETNGIICDMYEDGQRETVLVGGKGGRGNRHFASSRRQTPRFAEHGIKAIERALTLELMTIADVGLVGFPNVGKSTLLSVVSKAKPKIANYHFTTLSPNLGVVSYYDSSFVMADIPGLIEGASQGMGLGHSFLRHIERTRMLVHVLDISGSEHRDPIEDFETINNEIYSYSEVLKQLPMVIVANKMDMPNSEENLAKFEAKYGSKYVIIPMTTIIHEGVDSLMKAIITDLDKLPPAEALMYEPFRYDELDEISFEVSEVEAHVFLVEGGLVNGLARRVNMDDYDSLRYMQRILKDKGVIKALRRAGAVDGDTVVMGEIEFDFVD